MGDAPLSAPAAAPAGAKYILFELAGQLCGVPILQAREIVARYRFTPLPHLPESCRGVVEVREEPVPVIDLRRRFGLPTGETTAASRVIVVEQGTEPIGIEVDRVLRLAVVAADDVQPAPAVGETAPPPYLAGVMRLAEGRFALLLDARQLLAAGERLSLFEWFARVRSGLAGEAETP